MSLKIKGVESMKRWILPVLVACIAWPAGARADDCQPLDVYMRSAKIYMGAQQKIPDFKSAQKQLDKAIECFPDAAEAHYLLSIIYYKKRIYDKFLHEALEVGRLDAEKQFKDTVWQMREAAWGELFNKGVDSLKASNNLDSLRAEAQSAGDDALYDSLTNAGRRYLESAKGLFLASLEMDSTRSEPYQNIAVIDTRLQNWDEALGWYALALDAKPGDADLLRNMMSLNMRLKRPDSAMIYVREILAQEPDDIEALLNKAAIYAQTDHPDSANVVFEEIIQKDPDNKAVIFNLAYTQVQSAQAFDEQVARYSQQARDFTKDYNTRANAGASEKEVEPIKQKIDDAMKSLQESKGGAQDAWEKAEALFLRFKALDSTDAEVLYLLGLSEFWLAKYDKSIVNLQSSLNLRPDDCAALQVLYYAHAKQGDGDLAAEVEQKKAAAGCN
jgi:Tfp pilus assembly protein PilF